MSNGDFPRISTRGHFWVTWFRGETLTDGHDETDYDLVGDVPGITGDAPEELLVHDVSDRVNGHFDYVRPDRGCIGQVVADFG